jgi:hypothetical protein
VEGERAGTLVIARRLKGMGMSDDEIRKITGLGVEEIE